MVMGLYLEGIQNQGLERAESLMPLLRPPGRRSHDALRGPGSPANSPRAGVVAKRTVRCDIALSAWIGHFGVQMLRIAANSVVLRSAELFFLWPQRGLSVERLGVALVQFLSHEILHGW